jgi:hypothetical protein
MDRTGDRDSLPTSHDLRRTLNDQAPLVDGPAMPDVVRVRVRRVVRTTGDLLDVPEDGTRLHEGVREAAAWSIAWLAESVGAYTRLPPAFARSHALEGQHAPLLALVDELDLLGLTLDRVHDACAREDEAALDTQLQLLRETFAGATDPVDIVGRTDITPDQLDRGTVEEHGLEVGEDGIPRLPVPEQPDPDHESLETA